MSTVQKDPRRELTRAAKNEPYKSWRNPKVEPMDVVKRANALLCVRAGKSCIEAAKVAGYKSNDPISRLVSRFNQRGLLALSIAVGRGCKPTYTTLHPKSRCG